MNRRYRAAAWATLALLTGGAFGTASARGDGLPLPLDRSQTGVVSPDGSSRYQAVTSGRGTTVLRISAEGVVVRSRFFDRDLAVPAVAYDGTSSGLSADGETLVVIEPRRGFPRPDTAFVVLDANRLRPTSEITLRGDFSFDAISPDGQTMYLIEYMNPRDVTEYQVRAYDLERERLVPEPIIDPDEAPVTMGGQPATRATSPDGRWAYTLYDSLDRDRPPFIHALDTETGTAACIDLEGGLVQPGRVFRMNLEPSADGSTLAVVDRGTPVAVVDTETFEVTEPAVEADDSAAGTGSGGGLRSALAAVALGASGVVFAAVVRRRRRARTVRTDELERLFQADEKPGPTEDQARPQGETRADERARDPAGAP